MSDLWKTYLSVESLKAMSLNEEIGPDTVLPLAEAYATTQADNARLREQASLLEKRVEHYAEDGVRLRALIKEGCRAGEDWDECPWCGLLPREDGNRQVHRLACPAFTPVGTVR